MVVFLFYAGLSFMIKLFPDTLIEYLKSKIPYSDQVDFDKINEYNLNLFIVTCIGAICCLLAFICCIIYCSILKKKNKKKESGDVLANIDYSNSSILPDK